MRWKIGLAILAVGLATGIPLALAAGRSEEPRSEPEARMAAGEIAGEDPADNGLEDARTQDGETGVSGILDLGTVGGLPFGSDLEGLVDDWNEYADDLAAFLEDRGVDPEVVEVRIVTWDPDDEEAWEALEDFVADRGLPFGLDDVIPFDEDFDIGELLPEGIPFGEDCGFPFEWPLDERFPHGEDFDIGELFPEGMPFGEHFGFHFEWPFHDGIPFGEGLPFEGDLDIGELIPDEMIEAVTEQAEELAEYLDDRGIAHEIREGPFGIPWVEWDQTDEEANRAVAEFWEERGGRFRVWGGGLPHGGPLGPCHEDDGWHPHGLFFRDCDPAHEDASLEA